MGCGRNDDFVEERRQSHGNCICEVVRFIKRVQEAGSDNDCVDCETDCFLTPLGSLVSPTRSRVNTRVFTLSNNEGDLFKAFFKTDCHQSRPRATSVEESAERRPSQSHSTSCFSVFFRVQNIFDNCCATLQVLQPLDRRNNPVDIIKNNKVDLDALCRVENFAATNSCITVDLKCFCGIQCIKDVFIECCD